MTMKRETCSNCGRLIELDNSQESNFCHECRHEINADKEIQARDTNQDDSDESVQKWLSLFDVYLKTFEYDKAYDMAHKILTSQPNSPAAIDRYEMMKTICMFKIDKEGNLTVGELSSLKKQPLPNKIVIPPGVISIQYYIFNLADNHDSIKEIVIPSSVKEIDWPISREGVKITFQSTENFNIVENDYVLSKDGKHLHFLLSDFKEFSVPESVESIGQSAFYNCKSIASIKMDNVKTIGLNAFSSCENLTTLQIDNVKSIGYGAFSSCSNLTSVQMNNVESIGDGVFKWCKNLRTVKMNNVKSIGESAFNLCEKLTSVQMDNVKSIGYGAFSNCSISNSLHMDNVESIGSYAFEGCERITSLQINNVKSIADLAFIGCYNITSVQMNNVKSIGYGAFAACKNLGFVEMTQVESIENEAFAWCYGLSSSLFLLPNLTYIGKKAFNGVDKLRLVIPYTADESIDNRNIHISRLTKGEIINKILEIERKERISEYWEQNFEEYKKLKKQKDETLRNIEELGIFSFKERKELQNIVDMIELELNKDR